MVMEVTKTTAKAP